MYELRAATAADRDWLYDVFRAGMRPHVITVFGEWDEAFQSKRFADHFAPERFQVIRTEGVDVGLLEARREDNRIYIAEIGMLPEHQSRGIGAAVLRDLIAEANAARLPLELQVFSLNPARRLYERLGFAVYEESDTHLQMRYSPR
jgi:ribosomal protein S18 acetylase RimI-like enzyme